MNDLNYPSRYMPVAEDEMTYITGGESDLMMNIIVGGAYIVAIAIPVVIVLGIDAANTRALCAKYEAETGLSAKNEQGKYTSDFDNYKQRANNQGRNWSAGFATGTAQTVAVIGKIAAAGAAIGAMVWYMKQTNSTETAG